MVDEIYEKLEKRVRDLETAITAHVAKCTELGSHNSETMTEIKNDIRELKGTANELKSYHTKQDGKISGFQLAVRIGVGILVTLSVIGNIYQWLKG